MVVHYDEGFCSLSLSEARRLLFAEAHSKAPHSTIRALDPATMPQHRSTCSGHAFRRGKMEDLHHCYANDGVLPLALSGYLLEQMTV